MDCRPANDERDAEDAEWRRLTSAGNDAFAEPGLLPEALTLYREAQHEAERLFCAAEAGRCVAPATTIYVIACQNLAEAVRLADSEEEARHWLLRAFERLADAAESARTPFDLRIDCMRDLKFAYLNLAEERGADEGFAQERVRLMLRGRHVVACVTQVVEQVARLPLELSGSGVRPGRLS